MSWRLRSSGSFGDSYCYDGLFPGKERDAESGLDFFEARFMSSAQGRFTSPDPSNLSVDFWMPQTWNRYAYVGNNPLLYVDRNGLWWTVTHKQIIDDAFPGLSKQELKQLGLNLAKPQNSAK